MALRLLKQIRPTTTGFETAITINNSDEQTQISHIILSTVSNVDVLYSILHVMPGNSNDEDSALAWTIRLQADPNSNAQRLLPLNIPMHNIGETLVVKSSVASGLTFSIYGDDL